MSEVHLPDAAATRTAGAALAGRLRPGDLVLLSGPLGAGKTTFVTGVVEALGALGPVASPTFTVGRTYPGPGFDVHHLDLWRFDGDLDPDDWAALEPYFAEDAITFVEWPEVAGAAFPVAVRARVCLDHAGTGSADAGRTLSIDFDGDAGP